MGWEVVSHKHEPLGLTAVGSLALSRPKSLKDVTAQDHTIAVLQRTLQASNV